MKLVQLHVLRDIWWPVDYAACISNLLWFRDTSNIYMVHRLAVYIWDKCAECAQNGLTLSYKVILRSFSTLKMLRSSTCSKPAGHRWKVIKIWGLGTLVLVRQIIWEEENSYLSESNVQTLQTCRLLSLLLATVLHFMVDSSLHTASHKLCLHCYIQLHLWPLNTVSTFSRLLFLDRLLRWHTRIRQITD